MACPGPFVSLMHKAEALQSLRWMFGPLVAVSWVQGGTVLVVTVGELVLHVTDNLEGDVWRRVVRGCLPFWLDRKEGLSAEAAS